MEIGREHSTENKSVVLIFILFLNLFLMSFNIVLKNEKSLFANIIATVISPFQIGFQKTIDFVSYETKRYVFLKNMYHQYHELKTKHRQLKYENFLLRTRQKQLEFEKKIRNQQPDLMGAELIFIDSTIPYDCIMINKGSANGIKINMVILNENGELVGRVIDPVTMFSAKVRLITSRIGGVGAYIKKNRLEGLLTGNNQKFCSFQYLLENAPVEIGDEVITSGTDQLFPPYIPIGKVVHIKKEYLIQQVQVKPFFLERSMKQLMVLKKSTNLSEK